MGEIDAIASSSDGRFRHEKSAALRRRMLHSPGQRRTVKVSAWDDAA